MPHIKWCLFSEVPSLNPRFLDLLAKIRLEHPKYAFFIDFDYEARWEKIRDLLTALNIDLSHAFFAIRSFKENSSGMNDIISGAIARADQLDDQQIESVTNSLDDYFAFSKERLGRIFQAARSGIHCLSETDDMLIIHVNTMIRDEDRCFVDALQIDELMKKVPIKNKAVVAFGCEEPEHFVDHDLYAAICNMYKAHIYMCSSENPRIEKIVNSEDVWKVGVSEGHKAFCLCCIDTDLHYAYVQKYGMRDNLTWDIDRDIDTCEYPIRYEEHYGKKYLPSNCFKISKIHDLAVNELENGLDTFLSSSIDIQEWVIYTYQYHQALDYILEHYIEKIVNEKHKTWDYNRFEYLGLDLEKYLDCNFRNVLISCRVENLNRCRSWVDQIAWTIVKRRGLKIRIIIIGNIATEIVTESPNMVYIPLDIYHELHLPEIPLSREIERREQLLKPDSTIGMQYILSIFWAYMDLRKQFATEKNLPKYSMTSSSLYKLLEVFSIKEYGQLLQTLEGKELKAHENSEERTNE